ncbi:YhcN/YlaJ family sporulation lipoprotein [Saliterribacillus persicus]|uniref:YhcN/YlaJ family sporulation lipoprotein n=1 Tax=Saliterribacillus persicus TaxID=930114 RepID=A0A368XUX2_9BACI|nr:YhcN/YlaJ family sporulation lipoprotein [Saliterribacillus persicus]RCW70838.1 YhcN/YlaJ family sporulation lipoprotein [Saliterribacillus persicus]
MTKWFVLLASALLIVGCNQNQAEPEDISKNTRQINVENSDPNEEISFSNQEKAKYLAKFASQVPGVNDATAIVVGKRVLIGIDVDKDLDRARVGTIKYAVTEAVEHDLHGSEAMVFADGDIFTRLQNITKSIQTGEPREGIREELAEIVGRYIPETPIKEKENNENQNKNQLNKDEKEKLDEIEEEQSNEVLD